jgi:hypothetical protein
MLKDWGRAEYFAATDKEALDAFQRISRLEGIIPALETSHAFAYLEVRAHPLHALHWSRNSCATCSSVDGLTLKQPPAPAALVSAVDVLSRGHRHVFVRKDF